MRLRRASVAPPAGPVFVVRWRKASGEYAHRFFFSEFHARRLHRALINANRAVGFYVTPTRWQEHR